MNKETTMKEVLGHEEDYYGEEFQETLKNDFAFLERLTENCTKNEVQRIYDMINGETRELMDMVQYIANNKN